jgi:hypothetical protein
MAALGEGLAGVELPGSEEQAAQQADVDGAS